MISQVKSESQYLFCKRRAAARSLLFNHSSWKEMRCENLDARSTCQIISRLYILSKVPSWHFSRETTIATWSQDQEWHQSMSSCNTLCNFKMTSISIKVTLGFFITFTMGWKLPKHFNFHAKIGFFSHFVKYLNFRAKKIKLHLMIFDAIVFSFKKPPTQDSLQDLMSYSA